MPIQVDAWGAFVPDRAVIIESLKQGVVEEVNGRNLPNLAIRNGTLDTVQGLYDQFFRAEEPREYIFFTKDLGKSASALLALRIAQQGAKDMQISWRLLEDNPNKSALFGMTQGSLVFFGIMITLAGLITSIFGFGLCAIPFGIFMVGAGLGWWRVSANQSQLTPEQKLDSRTLAQTVDYCLMAQLEKHGISAQELRILQASQMQGIGRL